MKTNRRKAREAALQNLYQLDYQSDPDVDSAMDRFEGSFESDSESLEFAKVLVEGVTENIKSIDSLIKMHAENWRLDRMDVVDRNLLRLGVYELQYRTDIPVTVTINEMIELAKSFGSEKSPSFVNGILDKIKASLDLSQKPS